MINPQSPSLPLSASYSSSGAALSDGSQRSIDAMNPPPSSNNSDSLSGGGQPKYSVAMHTVRITKHGFAIDPVDLKYSDITSNMSTSARRNSELAFDANQLGHKILAIIRGFWSQPGFPRGRVVKSDLINTLDRIMDEFDRHPGYPHRETFGLLTTNRPEFERPPANVGASGKVKVAAKNLKNRSLALKPLRDSQADKFVNMSLPGPAQPPAKPAGNLMSAIFGTGSSMGATSQNTKETGLKQIALNEFAQNPRGYFFSWIPKDREEIGDLISTFLVRMQKVFAQESRILTVSAPCTVLGDIHGNLTDLRTYERSLWPKAPACLSSNYLFLGDYVDRGDFSVECVLYLFAMKLISPQRFFLLRGNHEVAAIQRQYTFSRECEIKFGLPLGRQIWRSFNKVFDLMPVAAIVDEHIFCAHGGIPRTVGNLAQLAKEIPSPMDNPEVQCPSAWEILWNDPITDSELIGMIEMDNTVVTQTQITQTQPASDGKSAITTTTVSTTIKPQSDHTTSGVPGNNPATSSQTGNSQQTGNQSGASRTDISEADAILSREPPVALSFYIKSAPEAASSSSSSSSGGSDKGPATGPPRSPEEDAGSDTIRKMPSDTSSIASNSPQQMINDGFVANIKRGTAYLFSDQAINNFLQLNRLSHVIRAHEVIPTGFAFHGDGRVITIFSSSKYCGLNNQAACAFIDQNRIRILRLDTGDAGE